MAVVRLQAVEIPQLPELLTLLHEPLQGENRTREATGPIEVELDLSDLETIDPLATPALCVWAHALHRQKTRLRLVLPDSTQARREADQLGLVEAVCRKAAEVAYPAGNTLPLTLLPIHDTRAAEQQVQRIARFWAGRAGSPPAVEEALVALLRCLFENQVAHAGTHEPGVVTARFDSDTGAMTATLADSGIGIRESLQSSGAKHLWVRMALGESPLALALEPLTSCKLRQGHEGMGLFRTHQVLQANGGRLVLSSGEETVSVDPDGQRVRKHARAPGTLVSVRIESRGILEWEEACQDPPRMDPDAWATLWSGSSGFPVLTVTPEHRKLVSRERGRLEGARLKAVIQEEGAVALDLDSTEVLAPEAAEALFGPLFSELGADRFTRCVRMIGGDDYERSLVERVIGGQLGAEDRS